MQTSEELKFKWLKSHISREINSVMSRFANFTLIEFWTKERFDDLDALKRDIDGLKKKDKRYKNYNRALDDVKRLIKQ